MKNYMEQYTQTVQNDIEQFHIERFYTMQEPNKIELLAQPIIIVLVIVIAFVLPFVG